MRRLAIFITLILPVVAIADDKSPAFSDEQMQFFEKEVMPVLRANCYKCHGDNKPKGELRLTARDKVLTGGNSGPVVDLKNPDESLLLRAVRHQEADLKMPPTGKQLAAKDIDTLAKWVKLGLPMPSGKYWAYQPVRRLTLPAVKNTGWVRNPIDAFILAKLEAKGLAPAGPAEKVALLRRAYYDLTGLPPKPEDVDAFLKDESPDAYSKLIDCLLDSPQYGEKWGRHWLDLVRYAETNGYERDGPKPFAWRYRDYVIKSFNTDKPFDRFIKEQLAGDEIDRDDADAVIATGYYRLGLWDDEPADPEEARFYEFDDWVATTAQVFLGMTMNCCRCHDHKIDPIPQTDYYRMLAFFQDVKHFSNDRNVRSAANLTDISPREYRQKYEAEAKKRESRLAELDRVMRKLEDAAILKMPAEDQRAAEGGDRPQVVLKVRDYFTPEQEKEYFAFKREASEIRKNLEVPKRELALSVNNCLPNPPTTFVMMRGNAHAPGTEVSPGFPKVLDAPDPVIPKPATGAKSSGRRTALANWIASKENPLTARVIVNRVWQHHFGRGIVGSTNDFGKFGVPPTHPELLDWLASDFVENGWTFKRLHKLIMLSNTYRMSSRGNEAGLKIDPANQFFWRFNMRRLSAEEVRDSFLAASGNLNLKSGGPSVFPPLPKEVLAGQSRPGEGWNEHLSPPAEANRRSVYVHIKRSLLVPVLSLHDQADTDSSCPVRYTTTVPTQALGLLNGEFGNEQAAALAGRLQKEFPNELQAQVRRAIRLTTARSPGDDEMNKDVAFVQSLQAKIGLAEAMKKYCLLVLNANEFVYVD